MDNTARAEPQAHNEQNCIAESNVGFNGDAQTVNSLKSLSLQQNLGCLCSWPMSKGCSRWFFARAKRPIMHNRRRAVHVTYCFSACTWWSPIMHNRWPKTTPIMHNRTHARFRHVLSISGDWLRMPCIIHKRGLTVREHPRLWIIQGMHGQSQILCIIRDVRAQRLIERLIKRLIIIERLKRYNRETEEV